MKRGREEVEALQVEELPLVTRLLPHLEHDQLLTLVSAEVFLFVCLRL